MCFKINFPEKPKILLIEFLKARHIHWSLHCFSQTHTQIILYIYILPFFFFIDVNLLSSVRASLVPQLVKNLPEMHLTRVRSLRLGRSPGAGNGFSLQYSGWRIPWTIWSMESQRVTLDWGTFTSLHFIIYSQSHIQFILSHFSPSYSLYYWWCMLLFNSSEGVFKLGKTVRRHVFLNHYNLMWAHSLCRSKEESKLEFFNWYSSIAITTPEPCFQRKPRDLGTTYQFDLGGPF